MKKNIVEKYFAQKSLSIVEIICIIVAAVALIISTFVWGGLPIGMPIFIVAVGIFIGVRTSKIKDSEIDELIDKIIADNEIDLSKENAIKVFNLKAQHIKKGNDGKLRTNQYVASVFEKNKVDLKIYVYFVDLIQGNVEKKLYTVKETDKIYLKQEYVMTPFGRKEMNYLFCDTFECIIPVHVDDVVSSKLFENICCNENV